MRRKRPDGPPTNLGTLTEYFHPEFDGPDQERPIRGWQAFRWAVTREVSDWSQPVESAPEVVWSTAQSTEGPQRATVSSPHQDPNKTGPIPFIDPVTTSNFAPPPGMSYRQMSPWVAIPSPVEAPPKPLLPIEPAPFARTAPVVLAATTGIGGLVSFLNGPAIGDFVWRNTHSTVSDLLEEASHYPGTVAIMSVAAYGIHKARQLQQRWVASNTTPAKE